MNEADDTFVKLNPAPLEAAGLRWLAAAGARVSKILADSPDRLVLQRITPGYLSPHGEEDLGRMLAHMHLAGAPHFGSLPGPGRFFVGMCELESPEPESPELESFQWDDWNSYYLQHRLMPLALRAGLADVVEHVVVDAPVEPAARLHGDLWSGNVLADQDGLAWLIDPAAYGGHREVDLAMLDLFGRVSKRTRAAYNEVYPLAERWQERVGLWQLFPLLVHAVLFGGGYLRQAAQLATSLR